MIKTRLRLEIKLPERNENLYLLLSVQVCSFQVPEYEIKVCNDRMHIFSSLYLRLESIEFVKLAPCDHFQ